MKKNLKIFILIGVLSGLAFLVGWKIILPRVTPLPYKVDKFNIKELKGEERPFVWDEIASLQPDFPTDHEGIIIYEDNEGNKSYHPNQLANVGLYVLSSYKKTNNEAYLTRAEKHAKKLIEKSAEIDGALYFPYEFNFALHNIQEEILDVPWYSGMAQGEGLSLFVRLYQETRKKNI